MEVETKSEILPAELKGLHLQITRPRCHYNHLDSPPSPPNSQLYLSGLHTNQNRVFLLLLFLRSSTVFKILLVQHSFLNIDLQPGGEWVIILFINRIPTMDCFVMRLRKKWGDGKRTVSRLNEMLLLGAYFAYVCV